MPLLLVLLAPPVLVLIEILIVLAVAGLIGLAPALLILAATSIAGLLALRAVGPRRWRRFQQALREAQAPGRAATDGLLAVAGAGLLAVPGYLTDLAGIALLIRPVRERLDRVVEDAVTRRMAPAAAGHVFGPRTVHAHQRTDREQAPDEQAPLEGDIVDSGPRR